MSAASKKGGYDAVFMESSILATNYECPICTFALRDPVQTKDCGHRYCKHCFEDMCKRGKRVVCPLDRTEIDVDKVFEDKAVKREILDLKVKCTNFKRSCKWKGELRQLEHHKKHCKRQPVKCVNDCGETNIPREEMLAHIDVCQLSVIPCPYAGIGCNFQNFRRRSIEKHMNNFVQKHLDLAVTKIASFGDSQQARKKKTFEVVKKRDRPALSKIHSYEFRYMVAVAIGIAILSWLIMTNQLIKMKNDPSTEQRVGLLESSYESHTNEFSLMKKRFAVMEEDLKDRKNFIMVIKEYHAKLDAAKIDDKEIFSTPVYISHYKMRLAVYLNGNGEGKSSHMSVFLNIMRGEWDPIIKWPFDKNITFCLINQEEGNDNICSTLYPENYLDVVRTNFERPDREVNTGYGFREFAPHEKIDRGGFAKDDTIFLKCEIEI